MRHPRFSTQDADVLAELLRERFRTVLELRALGELCRHLVEDLDQFELEDLVARVILLRDRMTPRRPNPDQLGLPLTIYVGRRCVACGCWWPMGWEPIRELGRVVSRCQRATGCSSSFLEEVRLCGALERGARCRNLRPCEFHPGEGV